MSYCGPCPLCGAQPSGSRGHACVPKPPIRGIDYPWPPRAGALDFPAKKPRRTVCADCRFCGASMHGSYDFNERACNHENARHLVTGKPTECSLRNLSNCPDFKEKQP